LIAELLPEVDVDGPRVRLGLAWAAVTTVAVLVGPLATALVFAPVALGAAGQTCRTWRRSEERRPYRPVAVGGAALCPLAAVAGPVAVTAAAVLVTVAALAASQLRWGRKDWDARLTISIAVLLGTGAASIVVARDRLGLVPALALLAWIHAVDASAFIVGSGAGAKWEGIVAGAASAGALGLAVAAVLVPPFRGLTPVVLAAIPAALVPVGTMVATSLLGPRRDEAPVPALRRLDAFLVTGPVWVLVAALLLDLA
jgi:hypothetical protein